MAVVKVVPFKDVDIAAHSRGSRYYVYQTGLASNISMGSYQLDNFGYAYQSRMLLQYVLPQLPVGAIITSAKLKMYLIKDNYSYGSNNNPKVNIHRIVSDWDQGTGNGQQNGYQSTGATWTNRTANGSSWGSNGSDFDPTPIATKTESWNDHWWEFDVKSLIDQWYSNPSTNKGLMVKYDNDTSLQGAMWTWSHEGSQSAPYIEITYNTPPEKPRGLVPNFDSFVCYDLSHTTHFKWNFIDTAAMPGGGKSDVVFMINTSDSMAWNRGSIRAEINRYIDRMNEQNVAWQIGLVSFCATPHGQPTQRWGWFTQKADVLWRVDNLPVYPNLELPKSGLEGIMDGALAFPWRSDAKKQIIILTDAPFFDFNGLDGYYFGWSSYAMQNVINTLNARGIVCSCATNTHCTAYTQLIALPSQTGGQYFDESGGWGNYLKLLIQPYLNEEGSFGENDYQTRADLRVFKIQSWGAKDLVWSYTLWGGQQELMTKSLGIPWEEGASYEWDVMCYDSSGLASPWSDRAKTTYVIDVSALIGVPMYSEQIVVGQTINKKALLEFRSKLYDEVKKYRDLDPGQVLTLFSGEVVPSKSDMTLLRSIMNQMLTDDGEPGFWQDLVPDGVLGVSDIDAIRSRLVKVSYSPPDQPSGGHAIRSIGSIQRPVSIASSNANSLDTTIDVVWTPSEYLGAGWSVRLNPSNDTDINYYKFYHEQVTYYSGLTLYMLSETYFKAEQIQQGSIFVPDTGRTDAHRMWYTPHDMNGRTSWAEGNVWMDWGTTIGTPAIGVSYYELQYQQKSWGSIKSDPNGIWYGLYAGGATSITHTVSAEASYWYRVRAIDQWGRLTDWTYAVDRTYVKY